MQAFDRCLRCAYITRPRDLIVERKGHNQSLSELLRDLRRCVYKLDSLMSLFSGRLCCNGSQEVIFLFCRYAVD